MMLFKLKYLPGMARAVTHFDKWFHEGKLYPEDSLARFSAKERRWFEAVGELPSTRLPTALAEIPEFCQRWIEFLLDPVANQLGDAISIFVPILRGLREAVERMPDAPVPPENHAVDCSDPIAVAKELKRWRDWVPSAPELGKETDAPKEPPAIWFHGGQSYSADREKPVLVNAEQHNILKTFLDRKEAASTESLGRGTSNVARVIDAIATKFGEASIRRPKRKGDGYFIRVRSVST